MENMFNISCDFLVILVLITHLCGSVLTSAMLETNVSICQTSPYVKSWKVEDFPNPQTDISSDYCGRGCRTSWICDPGYILTTNHGKIESKSKTVPRSISILFPLFCSSIFYFK